MKACVIAVACRQNAGTQTITGVVDRDGNPFIGKLVLFQFGGANTALNAVQAGAVGYNNSSSCVGVDTGTVRSGITVGDTYSPFGFKACAGGLSLGDHSVLDGFVTNFGQFTFFKNAKVSAFRSGEVDILYDLNTSPNTDALLLTVFGGDDIDFTFTNSINGTYTTPTKPQGLLNLPVPAPASSGSTAVFTGGANMAWGFATRDGAYGTSDLYVVNQGDNFTVQRTDGFGSTIDGTTGVAGSFPQVSAWADNSYTISGNSGTVAMPMVVSGATIACAGGAITQPLTPGTTVIDLGLDAKWIAFFSTGYPSDTAVQQPVGEFVMGWASTITKQVGFWTGEKTNGNTGTAFGARYLSDSTVLRFGSPNAISTTFNSIASLTDLDAEAGTATVDWTTVDGTARQVLWFAIGEAIAPPPPPPTPSFHVTTFVRRRLRRSPILWSENQGLQTQVRVNLIAVDMQPGVSTQVDTPDAQVMIRASKDGGRTWTSERFVSVGAIGAYTQRLNTWRWGQGRQWVVEVSTSDPVVFNLVNLYIDAEPGTS